MGNSCFRLVIYHTREVGEVDLLRDDRLLRCCTRNTSSCYLKGYLYWFVKSREKSKDILEQSKVIEAAWKKSTFESINEMSSTVFNIIHNNCLQFTFSKLQHENHDVHSASAHKCSFSVPSRALSFSCSFDVVGFESNVDACVEGADGGLVAWDSSDEV